MTNTTPQTSHGRLWLNRLCGGGVAPAYGLPSVLYADADLGGETARFIAVVPDPDARFPRARQGEVGLEEGWTLARLLRETKAAADDEPHRRPIIAVVDVASQAYGRVEEMLGVHLACAAAADAYVQARLAGHPIVALLVGKAMSGAFLAHGYQANRLVALHSPGVLVHAMGKAAAARITRRPVEALDALGGGVNADDPADDNVERVRSVLAETVQDIRRVGDLGLSSRLSSPEARHMRAASIDVRRRLAEQWDADA
jgi:malonate decarboxylase gamma subunit